MLLHVRRETFLVEVCGFQNHVVWSPAQEVWPLGTRSGFTAEVGGSVGPGEKWQISTAEGGNPVWRGDGKEIFYIATDGKLMSVAIESGKSYFRPGTPKPLFQTQLMPSLIREYDVMGDGKRFLLNVPALDNADEPITVVVNWPKLLRQSAERNGSQ